MRTVYADPVTDTLVDSDIADVAAMLALFSWSQTVSTGRGHPMLLFTRTDGAELGIAAVAGGAVMHWNDPTGQLFYSRGIQPDEPTVNVDYLGSYTELSGSMVIPITRARRVLTSFAEGRDRDAVAVTFAPDPDDWW